MGRFKSNTVFISFRVEFVIFSIFSPTATKTELAEYIPLLREMPYPCPKAGFAQSSNLE